MKVRQYYTRILQPSLGAWRRRPFPGPYALGVLHALRDESKKLLVAKVRIPGRRGKA